MQIGLLNIVFAVVIFLVVWRSAMWFVRMLSWTPPEVDPEDIVAVDQTYKCSVCGTEVVMTAVNVTEDAAPKHCREEMNPVWRP